MAVDAFFIPGAAVEGASLPKRCYLSDLCRLQELLLSGREKLLRREINAPCERSLSVGYRDCVRKRSHEWTKLSELHDFGKWLSLQSNRQEVEIHSGGAAKTRGAEEADACILQLRCAGRLLLITAVPVPVCPPSGQKVGANASYYSTVCSEREVRFRSAHLVDHCITTALKFD